jgi:AraC-like DNA-binding protein
MNPCPLSAEIPPPDGAGSLLGRQNGHALTLRQRRRVARSIEPAIDYMLHHVNEPLSNSTLCEIAGMSASHFSSLFRSVTGYPPMDFFIRLRMHRACELLHHQGLSIKEAAALLGYDDPCYFSRVFKSFVGVAPGKYRKTAGETLWGSAGPQAGHVRKRAVGCRSPSEVATPSVPSVPGLSIGLFALVRGNSNGALASAV